MGPVKDSDVLKCVKDKNRSKLLKLLAPERGFMTPPVAQHPESSVPGGRIRIKLTHVNVNCSEPGTGYTPLIMAILNGSKEIVEDLIFHSADLDKRDFRGNTPLHMAVFGGKMDMLDILILNKANVELPNSDGNTPLHIACQMDQESRVHVLLKLLKAGASPKELNKDKKSALDIAAMFNKTDAVSVLLDHDPSLKSNTHAVVEAAIRGSNTVVEMLLDYGVNPNGLDNSTDKDTYPLVEAVRYVRFVVAETLLKYGADSELTNSSIESARSVAKFSLPQAAADKFEKMFEEYKASGQTVSPRFLKVLSRGMSVTAVKEYPMLPTDDNWTENSKEFCSSCTTNAPNTNLLDGNLVSCWIAGENHHAWTVLDLKHIHTLTGITIYGWDSPQMAQTVHVQRGNTIEGPWSNVATLTCKRQGGKKVTDPGVPQTYKSFTSKSRYWRLEVLENHGGKCICIHGIELFGADDRIHNLLEGLMLEKYTEDLIIEGYNTYKKFLLIQDGPLQKVVTNEEDRKVILAATDRARRKAIRPSKMTWHIPPVNSTKEGEVVPDFVVKSNPGVKTEVQLLFDEEVKVTGETKVLLQSDSLEQPSFARFSGIAFHTCGKYRLLVQSVENENLDLPAPEMIEIKAKPGMRSSMAMQFDDMEAMLKDLEASLGPGSD